MKFNVKSKAFYSYVSAVSKVINSKNALTVLNNFLLELKGDFPNIHEKFKYRDLTFEILKKEQRRISRVKVSLRPSVQETSL